MPKKTKVAVRKRVGGIDDAAIRRVWGDVEVVDSEHDLRVTILPQDLENAARKDAGNCVFAQACRRSFGSGKVLFFRRVAYVELPRKDGTIRVERFLLGRGMRELIEAFDRGETTIPKAGFVLKTVNPSDRFEQQRKKSEKRREQRARQKIEGRMVGGRGFGALKDKPLNGDLSVRSGTGAVHFTRVGPES